MKPLFDGRSKKKKIADAIDLLQSNGYVVRGPLIRKSEVQTPSQLVRFFYDTLAKYNPEFKMVFSGNPKERGIAKRFIESRVSLGVSQDRAVGECCDLIELLFKYERYLGLNFKITSMGVLGQENMSWVTERLVQIYEGVNAQVTQDEESKWWQELYDSQENNVSVKKLEDARNKMDRILSNYAQKEKDRNG